MRVFRGEIRDTVDLLAFGPGERLAAAVAGRGRVDVWDCVTGHLADPWRARDQSNRELSVKDVAFLPDGRVVGCVGGYPLQVFDPNAGERTGVVFPTDADGSVLGPAVRFAVADGAAFSAHSQGKAHPPCLVRWRPDGDLFEIAWTAVTARPFLSNLAVSRGPVAIVEMDEGPVLPDRNRPTLVLRSGATGVRLLPTPPYVLPWADRDRLRLSPDGSRLLVCNAGSVFGWGATDGREIGLDYPTDDRKPYTDIAFHPSGRWFLTCGDDARVRVWDADSFAEVKSLQWGLGRLRSVAVSADGTLAAAGGEDGNIVVWDLDL